LLTVAGAGMGGLCAAARARELGLDTVVLEKGDRPGGSMVLSSGVVWRHRTLDEFRAECPGGDPALQAQIMERLDGGIAWLESLGAPVLARETGNPHTVGVRFEPSGLTAALVRAAARLRLGEALPEGQAEPVILATGGFAAELARQAKLPLRANRWSEGDGLRFARARGAALAGDLGEFYGRTMPAAPFGEAEFVRAAQLYGRFAVVLDEHGGRLPVELSWSEVELPQALARSGGDGWLIVDRHGLQERIRGRSVEEMVETAAALGAEVRRADALAELGLGLSPSAKLTAPPFVALRVRAAVTHTLGGVRIDERARVVDESNLPIPGLYACGADIGGIASGGYASGLAAALVFGRIAAESAAAEAAISADTRRA
jgi:fumarate reductase flavoprotein subunit